MSVETEEQVFQEVIHVTVTVMVPRYLVAHFANHQPGPRGLIFLRTLRLEFLEHLNLNNEISCDRQISIVNTTSIGVLKIFEAYLSSLPT